MLRTSSKSLMSLRRLMMTNLSENYFLHILGFVSLDGRRWIDTVETKSKHVNPPILLVLLRLLYISVQTLVKSKRWTHLLTGIFSTCVWPHRWNTHPTLPSWPGSSPPASGRSAASFPAPACRNRFVTLSPSEGKSLWFLNNSCCS